MGRLYGFHLLQIIREKGDMFWSLVFPLIMATFFFLSFGSSGTKTMMAPVPAAVVKEGNLLFETFLQEMDGETLALCEMEENQAKEALKEGEVDGIFYSGKTPSLTVRGAGIRSSILNILLESFVENQAMMEEIGKEKPLGLPGALKTLGEYGELIETVQLSGNAANDTLSYFFALVSMACLFGSFMGMTSAGQLRADRSALAARRCVTPTHRLWMVISQLLAVFTVQFMNVCILLLYLHFALGISFGEKWLLLLPLCALGSMTGVAQGMFIETTRLKNGLKEGIIVGSSLLMCFFSGLMMGNMKDILEHHFPILNRINPAALIADGFYSITVYDNPARYQRNLALLALITVFLTGICFRRLRRERYDSI